MNSYIYLDVELKLKEESSAVLTPAYFQGSIESSLVGFFGEIGGQTELELLKFDCAQKRAILKVAKEFSSKTRAAITLIGRYQDIPCHFAILKTSEKPLQL
ncbi:ribonuclease P protein subunit p14-like [Musca autumnalis]|uniref:ribonuclease P protein subunit p14-like n=1 Tax=Musca autumnalis TaxID=221902 RepID=UPI003CECEEA1